MNQIWFHLVSGSSYFFFLRVCSKLNFLLDSTPAKATSLIIQGQYTPKQLYKTKPQLLNIWYICNMTTYTRLFMMDKRLSLKWQEIFTMIEIKKNQTWYFRNTSKPHIHGLVYHIISSVPCNMRTASQKGISRSKQRLHSHSRNRWQLTSAFTNKPYTQFQT